MSKHYCRMLLCFVFCDMFNVDQAHAQLSEFNLEATSSLQMMYEPFSGLTTSRTWELRLIPENTGTGAGNTDTQASQRRLLLRFTPSRLQDFTLAGVDGELPIEIFRGSQSQAPLRLSNNQYEQVVNFAGSDIDSLSLDYIFRIPESIYAEPGQYSLSLDVGVFDFDTSESIGSVIELNLDVSVARKLQTNIAGTRGNYDDGSSFSIIDFDSLTTDETRRVFIQVRGNAQARIKISSENKGRLKHVTRDDVYINYSITADGEFSTLESPLIIGRAVAKTLQGSAYPMIVKIGDVGSSYAGDYQDLITIDVSPD